MQAPRQAEQDATLGGFKALAPFDIVMQNLMLEALQRGLQVGFCTLAPALGAFLKQDSMPAPGPWLKRCTSPHPLVLDALGHVPARRPLSRPALHPRQPCR